jgi:transposase
MADRKSRTILEKLTSRLDEEIAEEFDPACRFNNKEEFTQYITEGTLLNVSRIGAKALSIPCGEYVVWANDAGHTMLVPLNTMKPDQEVYSEMGHYDVLTPNLLNNWDKVNRTLAEYGGLLGSGRRETVPEIMHGKQEITALGLSVQDFHKLNERDREAAIKYEKSRTTDERAHMKEVISKINWELRNAGGWDNQPLHKRAAIMATDPRFSEWWSTPTGEFWRVQAREAQQLSHGQQTADFERDMHSKIKETDIDAAELEGHRDEERKRKEKRLEDLGMDKKEIADLLGNGDSEEIDFGTANENIQRALEYGILEDEEGATAGSPGEERDEEGQFRSRINDATVDRHALARAIKASGKSEQEIADEAGVDKSTVSRWLRVPKTGAKKDPGGRNPGMANFGKLLKVLPGLDAQQAIPDILGGLAKSTGKSKPRKKTRGSGQTNRAQGDTRRASGGWTQGNA